MPRPCACGSDKPRYELTLIGGGFLAYACDDCLPRKVRGHETAVALSLKQEAICEVAAALAKLVVGDYN